MEIEPSLVSADLLSQRQRKAKAEHRVKVMQPSTEAMGAVRRRQERQNAGKGHVVPVCSADKCRRALVNAYSKKCRLCPAHLKAPIIQLAGAACRWCQKCSKVHAVSEFDDERKSCRDSLRRHNARQKVLRSMGASQVPKAPAATAKAPSLSTGANEALLIDTAGSDYSLSCDTVLEVPIHNADPPAGIDEIAAAVPRSPSPPPTSEEMILIEQCWEEWGLDEMDSPGGLPPVLQLPPYVDA